MKVIAINGSPRKNWNAAIMTVVNTKINQYSRILVKNGYEVIELDSGFNGWTSEGMPVTK